MRTSKAAIYFILCVLCVWICILIIKGGVLYPLRQMLKFYGTRRSYQGSYLILDNLPLGAGFQPEIDTEFPTVSGKPRIPHNIHQIWLTSINTHSVPTRFLDNVRSFLTHNTNWTYYLWTNATIRALLADKHKELLTLYDSLPEIVMKGDLVRYVVIFEFGGLYADFDVRNFRPLDTVTKKYPCILVPEPFEHSVMWYERSPWNIVNAIMFCRPKHPFFHQVLANMPAQMQEENVVYKFGPGYLTNQFKRYIHHERDPDRVEINVDTTSPYFHKGDLAPQHDDGIYVPNTRFFMDSPSPALEQPIQELCTQTEPELSNLELRMCTVVSKRGFHRPPGQFMYLEHFWKHTWSDKGVQERYSFTSLKNITHKLKLYSTT